MNSKLVILSLLLAGTATAVSAQTKDKYYSESWKDNIYISVGGGVQATTNPDTKFGKSITPLVNLSIGKLINPIWGFRGQVYGWSSKMETNYPFESLNAPKVERKENYIGINLDGTLNLTNLFCGYKPGRVFELNFFAGPSMNVVKNYCHWDVVYSEHKTVEDGHTVIKKELDYDRTRPTGHELRCLVGASLGLGAKFNINPKWAIDVEARGQVTPSVLGAYSSGNTDGYLHLTAGATYTFGGKKFVSCSSKVDQNAINDELNKYRDELAKAQSDLADTKNAMANAKIDDYGKVNIQLAAKLMKANPDKKYKIAGYCDSATGSAKWNKELSEKRAQAVYDALVNEGVSEKQMELIGYGGTANMFGKDFLNRVVILE